MLLPRFYLTRRYGLYFAITVGLLVGVALLQPFDKMVKGQRESAESLHGQRFPPDRNLSGPPPGHQPFDQLRPSGQPHSGPHSYGLDIVSIVLFLTVWAVSMLLTLFRQWQQTERRAAQAELDKAQAELSFLKAQVNPHFLFNTLNNIYALAVAHSDRTPAAIMKLSNIMRYVTDEAVHDFVPLPDEVACLTDYIALQQLRLTNKTILDFTATGTFNGLQIAPLILMPFVENVFKYGISAHQVSTITISLEVTGNTVSFFCQNQQLIAVPEVERVGVGIENTKARLQHLYPKRHNLVLQREGPAFTVQLTLEL